MVGNPAAVTDGRVARDGTPWDDAAAVALEERGTLTFDLGEPRRITALYLQADANDTYQVTGSLVGSSGAQWSLRSRFSAPS